MAEPDLSRVGTDDLIEELKSRADAIAIVARFPTHDAKFGNDYGFTDSTRGNTATVVGMLDIVRQTLLMRAAGVLMHDEPDDDEPEEP